MKAIVKTGYLILSVLFLFYLAIPNSGFPEKPEDALQSDESADTESPARRAYFTDLTREETMNHYLNRMQRNKYFGFKLPTYRLNYPPEEAQIIIRDQTRSTFLEEVVHPFRESIFVNGFEPKDPKDTVFIENKIWRQKITIRNNESSVYSRIFIGLMAIIFIPVVYVNLLSSLRDFRHEFPKLWTFQ